MSLQALVSCDTSTLIVESDFNASFQEFATLLRETFNIDNFHLIYLDDEGDWIRLSCDREYEEALSWAKRNDNYLTIILAPIYESIVEESKPQELEVNEIVEHGVKCSKCEESIKGIRYKCLQCKNFNLCENCEGPDAHLESHAFLKLYRTNQKCTARKKKASKTKKRVSKLETRVQELEELVRKGMQVLQLRNSSVSESEEVESFEDCSEFSDIEYQPLGTSDIDSVPLLDDSIVDDYVDLLSESETSDDGSFYHEIISKCVFTGVSDEIIEELSEESTFQELDIVDLSESFDSNLLNESNECNNSYLNINSEVSAESDVSDSYVLLDSAVSDVNECNDSYLDPKDMEHWIQKNLDELAIMGFENKDQNEELLHLYPHNIDAVVELLIQNNHHVEE